jgi:YidC/Oxa1 family membrane protein insertase
MDNRNLILAIVLAVVIMVGYEYLFADRFSPPRDAAKTEGAPTSGPPPAPGTPPAPGAQSATGVAPSAPTGQAAGGAETAAPRIQIDAPRLKGSIDLRGARLDDLTLVDYRESLEPGADFIHLLHRVDVPQPYFARFGWVASGVKVPDAASLWTADRTRLTPETPVTLRWDNGEGLRFALTFALDENYMFKVTQRVDNVGTGPATLFPYGLVRRTGTPSVSMLYILHEGLLGVFDGVLEEIDYDDLQDEGKALEQTTTGGWIGITDKYWLTALIPDQKQTVATRFSYNLESNLEHYQVDIRGDAVTLAAGTSAEQTNRLFAGAKEAKLLNAYRDDLEITRFDLAIDWGWFEFLTKPIFFALLFLEGHLKNMGLAILVLTVGIKILFFPLANKSYRAMSKMKALQPDMVKIRERFANDRTKMNQEMMALYKREKANPASGCLPIAVQIPVFFALYKVLFVTIEMRHKPFFGWIQDLSAPDSLTFVNLFGLIDWTPPDFMIIGIWPIIMGVTMFLQQKLNPPPPDPTQAKIFMLLPFIFTVMLARFSAGLVIYWAWNNTLSILQQWYIMRRAGVAVSGGKLAPAPSGGGAGATKSKGGKKNKAKPDADDA